MAPSAAQARGGRALAWLLACAVAALVPSWLAASPSPAAWQAPARHHSIVSRSAVDTAVAAAPEAEVVEAAEDAGPAPFKPPPGKVALITGASTGIGLATVKGMAESGQYGLIIMAGRNEAKHAAAIDSLQSLVASKLLFLDLDLSSLSSVRSCVAAFRELGVPLQTLILNAGVMALPERRVTKEGFEYQFGVNHLAHFLLTNLLMDDLIAAGSVDEPARVISLSSSAHTFPSALQAGDLSDLQQEEYSPWGAYGQSKFANLIFAYELDRRCRERGLPVAANAVHPGVVNTELFDGDGALQGPLKTLVSGALPYIARSPDEGAATSVLLATKPEGKLSGRYWQDKKPSPSVDVNPAGQLPGPLQKLLPKQLGPRTSYDPDTWRKLWLESERLVGLRPEEAAALGGEP